MTHTPVARRAPSTLAHDVRNGLTQPLPTLPPKHLYDAVGSELFDQICLLPEYYPTRTERAILERYAPALVARTGAAELVELGSGMAIKTRVLLDAMRAAGTLRRYVPFDIAPEVVHATAAMLAVDYPELGTVDGVVGDFEEHLARIPPPTPGEPRLVALLGGTLGNFVPEPRRALLRQIGALLGDGDSLLVGVDLVKDPAIIEAAYNDQAGVTAAFNRNILRVLNRELGADFPLDAFEHRAFFDQAHEWIEMRLRATAACTVEIPGADLRLAFAAGDEIRTEVSAKFRRERLADDLAAAGLELDGWLTDADEIYALALAHPG